MNTLLENLSKKHKDFKLFKQLIKRQSKALAQYLNELIQISRQFNSSIFDGIHYHLFQFQSDLQNQYVLLKQLGKHFYDVKQEAQQSSKNLAKFDNKFDQNLTQKQRQSLQETKNYWSQKYDYATIRINDMSLKFDQIITKTNNNVQKFTKQHKMIIINDSIQENQSQNKTKQSLSQLPSQDATSIIIQQSTSSIYFSELTEREEMSQKNNSKAERVFTQTQDEYFTCGSFE